MKKITDINWNSEVQDEDYPEYENYVTAIHEAGHFVMGFLRMAIQEV